jgi:hypothetical protein
VIPGAILVGNADIEIDVGRDRVTLAVADATDTQAAIHTDTLNESGFVEASIAAFNGRTIHTSDTEGAGGGHAPDIIRVCGEANVLPSTTNPTRPFVNKTDPAPDVGASLDVMERDAKRMRGERPFVFTNLRTKAGLDTVVRVVEERGMLES